MTKSLRRIKTTRIYFSKEPIEIEDTSSQPIREEGGTVMREFHQSIYYVVQSCEIFCETLKDFILRCESLNRKHFVPKDTTKLRKGHPKKQYWLRIRSNPTRRKKHPSR